MSKNKGFAAELADGLDPPAEEAAEGLRSGRLGIGTLAGRHTRIAELASGSVVTRAQELVDPARCRMWSEHNRDYERLTEVRCADLIESLKAQGRQETPAIVRRVRGDPDHDFEVICGARRHWAVSWLRRNTYPDFRYLVEVRELTDEEAFRLSDLENRAREDLSDQERARDYLRALDLHYGGRQKTMAQRLNVTESWLSRYLDLARLPADLLRAFPEPHELGIKHVTQLKPLLKPDDRRERVLTEARRLGREGEGLSGANTPAIIRLLTAAADRTATAPKKSGPSKKSGLPPLSTFRCREGRPILRIDAHDRKGLSMTFFPRGGGSREDAEARVLELLREHWG